MVLIMEESYRDRTEDFTYAAEDTYTARLKREPGKMPLDNRAARVFEERYRPASRSLCGFNPPYPTSDGAAISRGDANDEIEEFNAQSDALQSLIDAAWRSTPGNDDALLRGYPHAVRHVDEGWVEFRLPRYDSPTVRLEQGEGYDFQRRRKIPAHSPRPDRAAFVPYTEVKALLAKRKETDDAG
nr:MAG TPA: hypothetical protein [Caudoviricetes sp.]